MNSQKEFQYSNAMIYFLVHTLNCLIGRTLIGLEEYTNAQRELLANNVTEANTLNRLQVVFKNESASVTAKANSIKVSLMQFEGLNKEIFKFPSRQVTRKFLKEYIVNYENQSKNSSVLSHEGNREDTLLLLRIVWAVGQSFAG